MSKVLAAQLTRTFTRAEVLVLLTIARCGLHLCQRPGCGEPCLKSFARRARWSTKYYCPKCASSYSYHFCESCGGRTLMQLPETAPPPFLCADCNQLSALTPGKWAEYIVRRWCAMYGGFGYGSSGLGEEPSGYQAIAYKAWEEQTDHLIGKEIRDYRPPTLWGQR